MGQALVRLAKADSAIELVGLIDRDTDAKSALNDAAGAVLIEFTNPEATLERVQQAAAAGVNVLVGTTGFEVAQRKKLESYADRIALIVAPNTSLGVNVLLDVVRRLAATLPSYDIELVEMHHRLKKDAPSGTAVALAEAAAAGREVALAEVAVHGRSGLTGERPAGQIGIHAVRGGDVVGEHTMTFAGPGERIEVVHRAHSRDTFAAGALTAAKWLAGRAPGLYTMQDVLLGAR
jgi:4-hydroxy-tetrahydrodipicolinate reductase